MACVRGLLGAHSKPLRQQRLLFGRKMRPKMVVWNRFLIEAPTKNTLSRGLFRVWPSRRPIWIFANWGFAAKKRGLLGPSRISPLLSDFFLRASGRMGLGAAHPYLRSLELPARPRFALAPHPGQRPLQLELLDDLLHLERPAELLFDEVVPFVLLCPDRASGLVETNA